MQDGKPVYQSKTFWFNVVAFVVTAVLKFVNTDGLPAEVAAWSPVIITVGNLVLRFVTSQPVQVPAVVAKFIK